MYTSISPSVYTSTAPLVLAAAGVVSPLTEVLCFSSWSEEGCRVLRYNTTHTICECDHLTNFAVLMDVHATPLSYPHHLALSIITYVGCVISIVCLLLATIVFHAFRGLKVSRER